jgi:hypothetical protein
VLTDPFELEVDTSGFAMGAVLLQKKEDGKKHPIAYYSKTLSAAERNYDVYDLKLLAIVNALDHWRPYLAGSPHKIIIYSDHQNLLYWKEPHKISRRVAREVLCYLNTTLKSGTLKEQQIGERMHYQDTLTMIRDKTTTKM